jgi:hypothetical protein
MAEVGYLLGDNLLEGKRAKEVLERLATVAVKRVVRRHQLAQKFGELAQLKYCRGRIVMEVALCLFGEPYKRCVLHRQEAEIGSCHSRPTSFARNNCTMWARFVEGESESAYGSSDAEDSM